MENNKKLYELLYKSFTAKDGRIQLESIKHKDGYIYASDGFILAAVNREYPSEYEGKAFLKNGDEIENKVDYLSVIPRNYDPDISLTDKIAGLRKGAKKVYRVKVRNEKAVIDTEIKSTTGDSVVIKAHHLFSAFQLFDLLKENFEIHVIIQRTHCSFLFESKSSLTKVLIFQEMIPKLGAPIFTIKEAANYVPKPKVSKAWYENNLNK